MGEKRYYFDEKGNFIPQGLPQTQQPLEDIDINHPAHYMQHPSGVECIDIAEHHSGNIFQVFKYIWRAGLKVAPGQTQQAAELKDLKKAAWYLNREILRLTKEHSV